MNILRVCIYQPQAHYRVPFTYQRRHTYPIPPYSTLFGFLGNLLGIDDPLESADFEKLKKIKISIAGRFKSKTTEYVWFRNFSKTSHLKRFGYVENRSLGGHIEHIGGQSPAVLDVLNEVELVIHLAHEDREFLTALQSALENPVRRLEVLHIGRAEDWIVLQELPELLELSEFPVKRGDARFHHFFWIPEKIFGNGAEGRGANFGGFDGLLYNVPAFWTVADFESTRNRHGQRIFRNIRARLNDGLIKGSFLYDPRLSLPVFLADLEEVS